MQNFVLSIQNGFLDISLTLYNVTNLLAEVVRIFVAFKVRASRAGMYLASKIKAPISCGAHIIKQTVASFCLT